ncbi:MAG: hypothetical protein KJ852_03990 [Gammaproteobacteria bacterium]|nr:hypothetical protein [Gammaproteobacteria bacterium]MBU0787743.1 hypothetical protein [Gammaproteobacteria bacterium]MBU0814787.1 hypothetical protein [Gammaproteobacteria bacterium]MBU1786105.1 hypothetical protein [Gammaproteobacteria bacterium]
MNAQVISARLPSVSSSRQAADIPMEQLVVDVYADATPAEKNRMIAQLIGRVYENASPLERCSILEQLLQPLGLLSLIAVANGTFAKLRLRGEWRRLHVSLEDVRSVKVSEVIALAEHVQQVNLDVIRQLAQMLVTPQMKTASTATSVLRTVLLRPAQPYRAAAPYSAAYGMG